MIDTKDVFAPTINLDGRTYKPKGYEWVLGFTLAGCQWAIDEASTEEFRNMIREDLKDTKDKQVLELIKRYESEILELKEESL